MRNNKIVALFATYPTRSDTKMRCVVVHGNSILHIYRTMRNRYGKSHVVLAKFHSVDDVFEISF